METKILYATIGTAILFFVIGAMFGVFYWEHHRPVDLSDTGISDEEYIRIAKQTPEVQKFLEKYPQAKIAVDRSGALAVDFRVDGDNVSGNINYLRLRVFINPRNHRLTQEKFIDCSGNYTWDKLLEYLQTEECLKVSYSETANWKTYRNEKHGFEFKYPPIPEECEEYCKIEESKDGFIICTNPFRRTDLKSHSNRFRVEPGTAVLRIVDLEGVNLSEFVNRTIKELEIEGVKIKESEIKIENILIGGKEGIRVDYYTFDIMKGGFGSMAFVEKNKKVLILGFSGIGTNYVGPCTAYEKKVYEAMLSTFRFLE